MNRLPNSTPKTIDEALVDILCIRPPEGKRLDDHAYDVLRDFMAQKFTVAFAKADGNEKALEILNDLFEKLTKRGI